ncbi:MAG: OadG family protein [Muribaculaceae bacterium]|nr:OadG family protein [Muribaculaceae bacterium]
MLKKIFLAASLTLAMTALPAASFAQTAEDEPAPMTVVEELPDGNDEVEAPGIPSEEVNTIPEGEIARKMTQAEKAENVKENDSWGGAITLISMGIVIAALILLSIFFACFGKISEKLLSKKKAIAQGKSIDEVDAHEDHVDSGEAIAAIAMALSEHFNDQHDMESAILTIRRLRRAYSPWNSKIYNIRQEPELSKNEARTIPVNKNYK